MIDLLTIKRAAAVIAPHIVVTPLRNSSYFSERTGFDVTMKLENWQPTGSFKVRGALSCVQSLTPEERLKGVVAWSAGNHALGVAYAASIYGVYATIFVPVNTPRSKLRKLRAFPVQVRTAASYEACEEEGKAFAEREGMVIVHPYDDWRTIAGQGTIGLEICSAMPEVDAVVVPVGGGGLISGLAIAARSLDPEIKIIAVQTDKSPALKKSLEDKSCYEQFPVKDSIAEGLAGGIGRIVYELAPRYIDELIIVEEDDLRTIILRLLEYEQMVVEPSGAVGLAALPQIECVPRGSRVVTVVTGGNLDLHLLRQILG